jgi:hypothetical protein
VVLALALLELYQGDFLWFGELLPLGDKPFGDGIHPRTGGELMAPMKSEEAGHSSRSLQRRHVHVPIHSVDSFDLPRHVLPENLCDRP